VFEDPHEKGVVENPPSADTNNGHPPGPAGLPGTGRKPRGKNRGGWIWPVPD
jgi:hypothetical protein